MASISTPVPGRTEDIVPAVATSDMAKAQAWPSARSAWTCVALLACAHMINMFDNGLTGFLVTLIKADLQASDAEMSLLIGFAPVAFYALVGLPMARLIDRYPRTIVMPIGSLFVGTFTLMCGLAQNFWQLFFARMFVGSSATVNGPGFYSLLADYFPPHKLSRAIAGMQVGFVLGSALAALLGGTLVSMAIGWGTSEWFGLTIRPWHKVYIVGAIGAFIVSLILWSIREPARRELSTSGPASKDQMMPVSKTFREIWHRRGVYMPLFLALGFMSLEAGGIGPWRVAFMEREYGWEVAKIGAWSAATMLIFSIAGLPLGAWMTEFFQKRYDDAPVRAVLTSWVIALPFSVAGPLMPSGELMMLCTGVGITFAMASAVPQNTAIQIITPNRMRAQVTAMYLFMMTVVGGLGANFLTAISGALGGEAHLGKAMAIAVATMMPLAIFCIALGLKPYAKEIRERRDALPV
ncbi:MFS transporter [Altererythrobacter indicus]|uniref:MFS transporter n=1 Tax=Altericroceibacterium indicum TaxID=374177 RepID=A0A845A4Z1_9SPHN|nr:MFS transporter [Altericroceibacterium indicum]MXP25260.1 MFS transporter [Altericroceibacterium indicum]